MTFDEKIQASKALIPEVAEYLALMARVIEAKSKQVDILTDQVYISSDYYLHTELATGKTKVLKSPQPAEGWGSEKLYKRG